MITIKSKKEVEVLREGGRRLASILEAVALKVKAGVNSIELNELAEKLARDLGDLPAFLNYRPQGAKKPFPAALCVSINDEIVHGIPNENEGKTLKDGDIVTLDMGLVHEGLITDSACTLAVGNISDEKKKLIRATREALYAGIESAKKGNSVFDISAAIEDSARPSRFSIPIELGGHGVGHKVHEDPFVPNFRMENREDVFLKSGMVLALEPMLIAGTRNIIFENDGYTVRTSDGSNSAHFEHTIVITDKEAEILTTSNLF